MKGSDEYERYLREEWQLFFADPTRAIAARDAVDGPPPLRILDVGCGAGQELFPFVADGTGLGIGLDLAPSAGPIGRDLYHAHAPAARVTFVRAAAEALPFRDAAFDLLLCRLALPYTANRHALSEMARVLRPGGALLLKAHHLRYYLRRLGEGLRRRRALEAIHALRVLVTGTIYHVTSLQPRSWRGATETFQSEWQLRRELGRLGLQIVGQLADSNPATPSYVILRRDRG